MPWYKDPGIAALVGAIAGALITAIASLYVSYRNRQRKRVDCLVGTPTSLLSISDPIKERLKVTLDGRSVSSVFLFPIEVINSGNVAVRNQPVLIRLADGSGIIDFNIETKLELGFGKIDSEVGRNSLDLKIGLLNPKDRVKVEVVSVDNPSDVIEIGLKNEGVESRLLTQKSVENALVGISESVPLVALSSLSVIPVVGSFADVLTTIAIARRIDRLSRVVSQE